MGFDPPGHVSFAEHGVVVAAWLAPAAEGLSADELLDLLERGFASLWRRAVLTLSDVTLLAIMDRVLCSVSESCPRLAPLGVSASGLDCRALREKGDALPRHQLVEGIGFVLVEFLTVLGNLTSEILTPALHAELSSVRAKRAAT